MINKLIFTFLTAVPLSAFACSCGEFSPESVWAFADRVFVGHVREASLIGDNKWGDIRAEVDVEEVLKGNVGNREVIRTSTSTAACGLGSFEVNGHYILFMKADRSEVTSCSGSFLLGVKGYERSDFSKKYLDELRMLSKSRND